MRRWTGSEWAGIIAGLVYAFNAHVLTRFVHLQAQHVEFFPLMLYALDRVIVDPRLRSGQAAGTRPARGGVRAAGALQQLPAGIHDLRAGRGRCGALEGDQYASTSGSRCHRRRDPERRRSGAVPVAVISR